MTFNPGGATTQYVPVPTYSDSQIEGNENFRGGVYNAGNTLLASSGYVNILHIHHFFEFFHIDFLHIFAA